MRALVLLALLDLNGYVSLRGMNAGGPPSWLEGDWGRLATGDGRNDVFAHAHLGVDWAPSHNFNVHVSGIARRAPEEHRGEDAGLIEAYADARLELGLDEVKVRAGQFFLPTSRENTDELWASPYTIHFSALNSWIAEEVRPIGVDLQYRHITPRGHSITGAATAFRGNDTMGTLLAWRGWTSHDRLSVYGEVLPLPPLESLDTFFSFQRDDGTQPFGRDLDGRTGYSARLRYSVPERGLVQYTFAGNRGDRALHGPREKAEYAWATSFHHVGAELGSRDGFFAAAEYVTGTTTMGRFSVFVDASFYTAYLLVSQKYGRNRWSGRYEVFQTAERDFTPGELNDEHGRAWTFTWMYDLRPNVRLAAEFTQLTGKREEAPDPDARSVTIEARYRF